MDESTEPSWHFLFLIFIRLFLGYGWVWRLEKILDPPLHSLHCRLPVVKRNSCPRKIISLEVRWMECHRMTEPIFVYRNADISLHEKPPMLCITVLLAYVLRHVSATLVSKGMSQSLITARKRSCGKVMFYTCLSFCSQGVVWLWMCASRSGCVCPPGHP